MRQFFVVGDEMGNIDVAVILLDQDILTNLISSAKSLADDSLDALFRFYL